MDDNAEIGLGFGVGCLALVPLAQANFFHGNRSKIRGSGDMAVGKGALPEDYPLTFEEPIAKDFRYKDQIRGTCGSIMDNIAEGFGRGSKLEFINGLTIAKGEAEELKSQLYRGLDVHYLSQPLFDGLYEMADAIVRKIGAFIGYLNKSTIKGQKFKERI